MLLDQLEGKGDVATTIGETRKVLLA